MYYEDEIAALNKSRIKYLIIGGIAINLYGVHRLTRDLDLLIEVPEENLVKFYKLMGNLGYFAKPSVEEALKLTAISFLHKKDKFKQVDIFIKNPINFEAAYQKRKIFKVKHLSFPCAAEEDIIKMKEKIGRDRDWIDIGTLKKIKEAEQK